MAGAPDAAVAGAVAVICERDAWHQRWPRAPVVQLAEPVLVLPPPPRRRPAVPAWKVGGAGIGLPGALFLLAYRGW